ncbi:hypothetical protein GCM10011390_50360 [Aureimonas endophytica]|uniref:Helix-turn-helix protein n=1 Tax=Aureimonas endophytica TaxID=2027858 RepID=A0A917EE94_9HYPH|nr:helix-turn-helix domain-containing protein [Aureimonas endophytica]GGE24859.1 hypothetical protein GCM10011390_50360 [Aureimonas endophytica]
MTAERYRMPVGMAALALVRSPVSGSGQAGEAHDLFEVAPAGAPHPDFAARAAIWRDQAAGLISVAEAQRRSANVGRAVERRAKSETVSVPRHARPAPSASRQYANAMATTAARDDRLVPQAKALLQVLRARCGKGRETATTKTTLAAIMSRSARSIGRYLRDLERFGYIRTSIRATARGLHTGLVIAISDAVAPFFEQPGALAAWLAEKPIALDTAFTGRAVSGFQGRTRLSPKNQTPNISILRDIRNRFGGKPRPVPDTV